MSKILVLGGAGFIGGNLVGSLLENGHEIRVFTRSGRSISSISHMLDSIDLVYGDFLDEYAVKQSMPFRSFSGAVRKRKNWPNPRMRQPPGRGHSWRFRDD